MKTLLTIAGSDSSGGAGILADVKTATVHGVFATCAITALTAQNTTGVFAVSEVSPEFLRQQLDAVFTDIPPDAVKIGMIPSEALIQIAAERLTFYRAEHIVLDPVMVATSGASLSRAGATEALIESLLPLAEVVTPNLPEAEVLSGIQISCRDDMERAAKRILERGARAVLCKGGHLPDGADDFLLDGEGSHWFRSERIENPNTHGTGCTLSSAIASRLASGFSLREAISLAKAYLTGALSSGLKLGKGNGPLDHTYLLHKINPDAAQPGPGKETKL